MRSTGWYDKPGVEIFEGRWQDWLSLMGEEEGVGLFDALYWDTFSCVHLCLLARHKLNGVAMHREHYRDLHQFFDVLPNLMRDEHSRFCTSLPISIIPLLIHLAAFFHGLGATSRSFYDVYTYVPAFSLAYLL